MRLFSEKNGDGEDGDGEDVEELTKADQDRTSKTITSLPTVLIQVVLEDQTHACRCPAYYEPNFDKKLVEHVKQLLRAEEKQQLTNHQKANICMEYRQNHGSEAVAEASRLVHQEAMDRARTKQARLEHQQQETKVRAELTPVITARIEASHEERVNKEVKKRVNAFWDNFQKSNSQQGEFRY